MWPSISVLTGLAVELKANTWLCRRQVQTPSSCPSTPLYPASWRESSFSQTWPLFRGATRVIREAPDHNWPSTFLMRASPTAITFPARLADRGRGGLGLWLARQGCDDITAEGEHGSFTVRI